MRGRDGRTDDGSVVVEFGVMFPVIGLLIAGMVAFGLAYDIQLTLQQAAREGVRVYALGSGDPVGVATASAPTISGMTVTTSGNCDPADPGDPAPQAWVETAYVFDFPFPFSPVSNLPLSSRAVMRCGG